MNTIVVVNGLFDWAPLFPNSNVHQVYLEKSTWSYQSGQLLISDSRGDYRPDGILWRLGAVTPKESHRACIELIRLAGVPCVNPPTCILKGYDRLSMLIDLKRLGLPVIDFSVVVGDIQTPLRYPAVLKFGNLHGGFGKCLVRNDAEVEDALTEISQTPYIGIEPLIDYSADIRCLVVGDDVWAMSRRSEDWRANVNTSHYELISPPKQLLDWSQTVRHAFGADALGLDFLTQADGSFVLLESNDPPGVLGFPAIVRERIAECLRARIR